MSKRTFRETIEVTSEELVGKVKDLIAEGNVRHVRIRQGQRTIAEFPLTAGVVGAVVAPVLAAVGALAAVLAECTIDVERTGPKPAPVGVGDREMDEQC
ncbi:MAG TPA: DUF4342 domain-containing protein [Vicinamibacterales bacterium]